MILMSSEILLFKGKDYTNNNKLGLLNFVHNDQCERVKTYPVRAMPIAFYADKGEKMFMADKTHWSKKEKRWEFTVYYSSKGH
jgi:hypothetical protein